MSPLGWLAIIACAGIGALLLLAFADDLARWWKWRHVRRAAKRASLEFERRRKAR